MLTLRSVTFDAAEPAHLAEFWAGLLGRVVEPDHLVVGPDNEVGLRFHPAATPRTSLNRMHLHVVTTTEDDLAATLRLAADLGATPRDVGQLPEERHVVLDDPEGNEFCVILPGNSYLAGTGRLGEVACDGLREVGVFWSEVLVWPLVWDEDEETAIQSPSGGTKIAWGGPPLSDLDDRMRLELVGEQRDLDLLESMGARWTPDDLGMVRFTDPGGGEFWVRPPG